MGSQNDVYRIRASRDVDDLTPGQIILIHTHFFPKEDKEDDSVLFVSEELTVVEINENELIVKDKYDLKVYIPVERYSISKGESRRIKPLAEESLFFIYAIYDDIGVAILDKVNL